MDDQYEKPTIEADDEVIKLRKWAENSKEHLLNWRRDAEDAYRFYAGDQWTNTDKQVMEDTGRPVISFNRICRTVNAVIGIEVQNRQEVRFKPRENDDRGTAEVLSETAKYVRDRCDAEDEESEASQDALICGLGFIETRLDYEENPDGDVIVERIDPLEMLYDPNAKKRNLDDAKWFARVKEIDKNEFKELWPNEEPQHDKMWLDFSGRQHDATNAYKYENDYAEDNYKEKLITVIQIQWWERETFYRAELEPGKLTNLDEETFNKLKDKIKESGISYVKQTRKRFKQAFINGKNMLEEGNLPVNRFTIRAITGLRDRNENQWFGLVKLMIDPQQWANKWMSQILYIVNSNAKGGIFLEEGALTNPRDFKDEWSGSPSPIVMLNDGAISQGKIQQINPSGYPQGLDRLLQLAIDSITDIAGVNLELLGLTNRDQAGVVEDIRQKAGVTILAVFFDSLRRYRKEQGRVLADYILNYMTDGRIVRIVGKDGEKYVPLLKDNFLMGYDIIVDDAPSSPNQRDRIYHMLFQFLPLALQAGIPIPPEVIDYMPLPTSLSESWKAMIVGDKQDPIQAELKKVNAQLAILEVETKKADLVSKNIENKEKISQAELNYAKAVKERALAADESAQAATKLGMDVQGQQHKQHQMEVEQARKDVELMLDQRRKDLIAQQQIRSQQNKSQ